MHHEKDPNQNILLETSYGTEETSYGTEGPFLNSKICRERGHALTYLEAHGACKWAINVLRIGGTCSMPVKGTTSGITSPVSPVSL